MNEHDFRNPEVGGLRFGQRAMIAAQGVSKSLQHDAGKGFSDAHHPFLDPKNYRTTEPGIVLFISLEMKPAAIADRLRLQTDPALLKAVGTNLRFLFGLPNRDRVVVAKLDGERMVETGDALQIQELLKTLNPKLIIIDTLIQIHRFDENQNIVMGEKRQATQVSPALPSGFAVLKKPMV